MKSLSFNLEQLFAVMPGHIYWLDSNNVYQGCNDRQAKAFGLSSRLEIVGKRNQDLPNIDLATAAIWDKNNLEILREGIPKILQEPSMLEDGKFATVLSHKIPLHDEKGHIMGLLGISVDITELKKQQDELESKIEQTDLPLEHILAHMPGHVYWKNKDGVYLGCNDSQAKTLGMSFGRDVVGKTDFDLPWGKELAKSYRENDLRIMETSVSETVEEIASINGKKIVYLSFKTSLKNKQGETVGILGISIDINKQKEAEEKLIKAKEQAEVANKAKTEFLENMRHDIRTPLGGIVGLAELLNSEDLDKAKIKEFATNLDKASKELLRFLNEVLESINVASGKIPLLQKRFNLGEILDKVVKLHQPVALQKQLKLILRVDEAIPEYLIGDSVRIYRIVLELLTNALKFTKSGHVNIFAKLGKKEEQNIAVKIFVEDTGIGIPAEKQQDLFVNFKRLTPSYEGIYEGAGLGLSIVKQFLEDIKGEIYVESQLNKGTNFVCIIPLKETLLEGDLFQDYTMPVSIKASTQIEDWKQNEKIIRRYGLVVEDQPIAALVAKTLLMEQSCEIDVAENGEIAIVQVQKCQYDFILMDIGLPDMDGYEVTKNIRLFESNSKHRNFIIGLAGHVDAEKKQLGLDAGMNIVLTKPLTQEMIVNLLKNFIPSNSSDERTII